MPIRHVVFDAYGTLFDVAAAARVAAEQPEQERLAEVWPKLAADWRAKQLSRPLQLTSQVAGHLWSKGRGPPEDAPFG